MIDNCSTEQLQHTLFLGCSVKGFSANIGFGEQVSEVTIAIVQDTCPTDEDHPKHYWDQLLIERTTTDADPGFIGEVVEIIGCPAYFRVGSFEFCGLIQSWQKVRSGSANPEYSIHLVSPVKILENTNLILSKYSGALKPDVLFANAPTNLLNVYGFLEGIGGMEAPLYCQDPNEQGNYIPGDNSIDGAIFGTAAGSFGGANINNNGIKWNLVKNAISVLCSAVPTLSNIWSPQGRLSCRGVNINELGIPWSNGYGLLGYDTIRNNRYVCEYCVDVSEVPVTPDYYRINGDSSSLLEVITKVCQESGFDFYVELLPMQNFVAASSGIAKLIKIRVISRLNQPVGGQISAFVENAIYSNRLESSSIGKELRNDITSAFIFGGPKETIYQAFQNEDPEGFGNPLPSGQSAMIVPYYGLDSFGNMIVPRYDSFTEQWGADFESDVLEGQLSLISFSGNYIPIGSDEMAAALTSYEEWESYIYDKNTTTSYYIVAQNPGESAETARVRWDKIRKRITYLSSIDVFQRKKKGIVGYDFILANADLDEIKRVGNETLSLIYENYQKDKNTIYNFVHTIASQYYAKAWAIRVPNTSAYLDNESQTVYYSEQPTNGGWTEVPYVLDLPNPSNYLQFFSDEKNKIEPFMSFQSLPNLGLFSDQDSLSYSGITYLRCNVQPEYVFADKYNLTLPRVVITVNECITEKLDGILENIGGIENLLRTSNLNDVQKQDLRNHVGTTVSEQVAFYRYLGAQLMPDAVAIPIRSNVLTYGPWSIVGPPGGIHVEQNDGLVPWEYGSYSIMNEAANSIVGAGLTNMQVSEVGSVTIAGYPDLPLGAEINVGSNLNGQHLAESRTSSYQSWNGSFGQIPFSYQSLSHTYGFQWQGLFGPNISSINISVDDNGIKTTYNMQTYTPKFGRFSELNAYRLRQVGQNRLDIIRRVNNLIAQRQLTASAGDFKAGLKGDIGEVVKRGLIEEKRWATKTPHQILVGELYEPEGSGFYSGITGTLPRTIIATYSAHDLAATYPEYKRKSYMSMDGLIRPISLAGEGGLPRYSTGTTSSGTGTVVSALIYRMDTSGNVVGAGTAPTVTTTLYDLNPFFNPTGYQFSELALRHTGTQGHDFEILGRGTGFPEDGILMPTKASGSEVDYRDDYRPFALRGPLVIQGWGYDLEGKPIPNQVDTTGNMYRGIFSNSGLSDNFYPDFGINPRTWPVGPVDLRWDRKRKVWSSNSTEQLALAKIDGHLGYNQVVRAIISDTGTFYYNPSGDITGYSVISGWNRSKNLYASGCELEFKYDGTEWVVNKDSHVTVLITGIISGAIWDRNITGAKPFLFKAPVFETTFNTGVSGSGWGATAYISYNTGIMVSGWNPYTDTINPGNGQGYIAKLSNGWLDNLDCRKVTI